jgi:hypothetical protein
MIRQACFERLDELLVLLTGPYGHADVAGKPERPAVPDKDAAREETLDEHLCLQRDFYQDIVCGRRHAKKAETVQAAKEPLALAGDPFP